MGKSKKYEWDYCTLSPEKLFGVYLGKPCCYNHDRAYCLEGKIETRLESDLNLRICIAEAFLAYGHSLFVSKFISGLYYRLVRMFGWYEWKTWSVKGPQPSKRERWLKRWENLHGRRG